MAWIEKEQRFLSRTERVEQIELLEAYIVKTKQENNVSTVNELPDELFLKVFGIAKELKRLKRIHRAETDLLYFSFEYFSEAGNPGNQGNWDGFDLKSSDEAADFHKEICTIMDGVSNVETNAKTCTAAPRGHGKSTYLSNSFPLREICFRKRKYIIAISETPDVAEKNIEWISEQLKNNDKLREDFGPLLSRKQSENDKDNSSAFIAWHYEGEKKRNLTLVEATSTGKAIRGKKWNGVRPDLIICDDLEDVSNTNTEELRQKIKDWFTKKVMPLGDPKGKRTAYVYMGTTVHHDCLLTDILNKRGDFKTKVYRAIINMPERLDLWSECEDIYTNPEVDAETREQKAFEFYLQNKEEMDKGAEVLWEEAQNIYRLFKWKWDNGSKAFSTEYMNNPRDVESQIFKQEEFYYYNPAEKDFKDGNYEIYFGVDYAMGKKERGDYSALIAVARHKRTKTIYVAESFVEKLHPDKFLDYIIDRVLHWQPDRIAADSNVAQEFLTYTLKERLRAVGYPSYTRVKEIKNKTKKELRIEALLPDIKSGKIQFNKKHYRLLEQFDYYPTTHDDGPDSLSMAVSLAQKGTTESVQKPWYM